MKGKRRVGDKGNRESKETKRGPQRGEGDTMEMRGEGGGRGDQKTGERLQIE